MNAECGAEGKWVRKAVCSGRKADETDETGEGEEEEGKGEVVGGGGHCVGVVFGCEGDCGVIEKKMD